MFKFSKKRGHEDEIEHALSNAYADAKLLRFESTEGRALQLDGVFALRVDGDTPHWLVVSRGLARLFDERGDASGPRFELTCRLPARTGDPGADFGWIVSWMQGLADYLAESGTTFEPFHQKKMLDGDDESISGLVFVADIVLPPSESGSSQVSFLQMFGLTGDELRALQTWQARPFVNLVRSKNPLLLTHPRPSLLRDAAFAGKVKEGSERDGSSMGVLSGVELLWVDQPNELQVHLTADAVEAVRFGLQHRLRHSQRLVLFGDPRMHGDDRPAEQAQVNALLVPGDGPSRVEQHGGMKLAVLRIPMSAIEPLLQALQSAPSSKAIPELPRVRFVSTTRERLADPSYPPT